ncbi:MAG: 1-phosphofructokinase family hexose kinase [Erysipelotrichaceae bacterium]|nr:1-phosphofructokinase family hexose kinase [Erysipelotrichaceae bacterium]
MIYTCTTNPSLDYFITLPAIERGKNNRTDMEMFDAGGKGVNVSIVLNNFRIPSVCLGFLGGFTKDYYLSFIGNYPNIQPLFTSIKDNTRINIKIMDDQHETSINAKGPHITDEEFNKFKSRLNNIYSDDIFVLSGNIEEEIKDRIIELVHDLSDEDVRIVLDTDRDILDRCLDTKLFAVKLNDTNLAGDDLKEYAKKLTEKNVKYVLYSAPHKSSYIFTQEKYYKCGNLKDSLVNTTGSADSMVAGFLYGVIRGADCAESFRYANAASLATCMSNDLGSKEKIEEVFKNIEIKEHE